MRDAQVAGSPACTMLSLIATGMPSSGERALAAARGARRPRAPRARARSRAQAARRRAARLERLRARERALDQLARRSTAPRVERAAQLRQRSRAARPRLALLLALDHLRAPRRRCRRARARSRGRARGPSGGAGAVLAQRCRERDRVGGRLDAGGVDALERLRRSRGSRRGRAPCARPRRARARAAPGGRCAPPPRGAMRGHGAETSVAAPALRRRGPAGH